MKGSEDVNWYQLAEERVHWAFENMGMILLVVPQNQEIS
jgi:hypothetical protein